MVILLISFIERGESHSMSSYQDSRSDTNKKTNGSIMYIYIYSIVVYSLCYKNYSLWSCMHSFYITVMPIGTCSLMLTLERGIASINIQIFISSLPSLGNDPLVGTIAVKDMKKLIPLYKTTQKNTQYDCWSSQLQ